MRFTTVERRALELSFIAAIHVSAAVFAGESGTPLVLDRKALEEHIRYLASDELGGRGNGTSGLTDAALYIQKRFQMLGLEPAGENGTYLQTFRVMTGQEVGRRTRARIRSPLGVRTLDYQTDFEPLTSSAAAVIEARVVFAGYGVTAPEHGYDDYASVDARGKIVLVLRYAPEPFGEHGWHATFVRKTQNAASHGAVGLLMVNGPRSHREDQIVPFGVDVGAEEPSSIPAVHLRRVHADDIVSTSGHSLLELQESIDQSLAPRSFEIERVQVALTVDLRRTEVPVSNVLGFLPATRSASGENAGEHILIGAHYDHLGLGEKGSRDRTARGSVHNGADDNASGVAGVLELARMFSKVDERPRGILFAAFAGEELGLRGSTYYTANPSRPLKDTVVMINLDMIGRLRHDLLYLGGVELLPQLTEVVEAQLRDEGLTFSGRFTADESSDHAPFIRAGVPALLFFTGLHGDYHKPTDDPQFINYEGMERVLRTGYRLSDYLLRTKERPKLAATVTRDEPPVSSQKRKANAAYFGIGVDASFDGDGVRFAYVANDGPAARAGLEAGDVLLEIDGMDIGSSERAAAIIQQLRPGETVSAKVLRKGRILEVMVRLSSWP